MGKINKLILVILFLFTLVACTTDNNLTYEILINNEISTEYNIGDEVDFKDFFIIKASDGTSVDVIDSMIYSSNVNMQKEGSYTFSILFENLFKEHKITVINHEVTYSININSNLSTKLYINQSNIDFKSYFLIRNSKNEVIEVTDSMLNLSSVDLSKVGSFIITISYNNIVKNIKFDVIEPENLFASDLFISEYSEGSSLNKYIEIFNGTGKDINLSSYSLKVFNNSSSIAEEEHNLSGVLKDGEILVIFNGGANDSIKAKGNYANAVITFNGNDPIALFKNDVLIDVVGDLNNPSTNGFNAGGINDATKDNTIIRNANVYAPNSVWTSSEWTVLGFEVYSNLKVHEMNYYVAPDPIIPIRTADLYISEYFEGNATFETSKYIEIYNPLDNDIDLSSYALALYSNGSLVPTKKLGLTGILKSGEIFVVYSPNSLDSIKNKGNLSSDIVDFDGTSSIAILKDEVLLDLIGVIGENPGESGWQIGANQFTSNITLVRDYLVSTPTSTWILTEWNVYTNNDISNLGTHLNSKDVQVIEDFDILFNLIKNLKINDKGTAVGTLAITIKGTVFMDVKNETTLVYITDGKNFIKLYGNKIHNYTIPNQVYEITGIYKSYIYQPTFEVSNPSTDIKSLTNETPVQEIEYLEVTLEEILALKRENFVYNIENGYLQSMLKVTGYLQLDTHNSTTWDYALTVNETYSKNNTQYINDGLYFKNDITELEDFLVEYEVQSGAENVKIEIFGVLYDWNPNRKNWRIYVSDELTYFNLSE